MTFKESLKEECTATMPGSARALDGTLDGTLDATLDGRSEEALRELAAASHSFVLNQTISSTMEELPVSSNVSGKRFPVENWDRYEFLAPLGQGGMGAVYKARDRRLGRIVALKFIRDSDQQMTQRFMQEARAQSRVDHPEICKVFDVGEVDGKAYIVMQYVEGLSLAHASKQLTLLEKVQIIRDAAVALDAAHDQGILHRDIKPANIMVERIVDTDGVVRNHPIVMDFGLAREGNEGQGLTESGAVIGTPAYMSPEQARGEVRRLDRRSDVYSLGATLYDLLSGAPPFQDESVVNIILKVLNDDVKPLRQKLPDISDALEIIVGKCLNKEPAQRYQTAQAFADDLSRFLSNQRIVGKQVSWFYRLQYRARRNKPVAALLVTLFVGACGFAGYGVRTYLQNLQREREAKSRAEIAQRLGQDIKEMELFMRAAYALPLHDITREQTVVRRRMQQLQSELQKASSEIAGPLSYALGRGHLVLREFPESQSALERAWKSGYRSPEARLALGLVLGERYRQELEQAQRAGDKNWIAAREKEIEAQYLKPALSYLEGARSDTDAPSYLLGMLAFYRKQYDQALTAAQRAQNEAPWLAEPLLLEGDVYQLMAIKLLERGQYREARELLLRAASRHQAAAEISSSDSAIYAHEATDWIRVLEADGSASAPLDAALSSAIRASTNASAADPRRENGYQLKAWAFWRAGSTKMYRGQSAESDIKQSVESAKQALMINNNDWQTYYYYGLGLNALAELARRRGEDTSAREQQAISAYRETIQRNKNFAWAFSDLGNMYGSLLSTQADHGRIDPELFREADSCYAQATQVDPNYALAYANRAYLHVIATQDKLNHGEDVRSEVELALRYGDKEISINPQFSMVYINMGLALLMHLEYLLAVHADVATQTHVMNRVATLLERARALDKDLIQLDENGAWLSYLRAHSQFLAGEDPRAEIQQGLKLVAQGLKREPTNVELTLHEARLHVLAGRWAGNTKAAEAPLFASRQAAARAVQLQPRMTSTHTAQCEAFRYSAAALLPNVSSGQTAASFDRLIAQGLFACTAALNINETNAIAQDHGSALYQLRAQRETDLGMRRILTDRAHHLHTQALSLNPNLAVR